LRDTHRLLGVALDLRRRLDSATGKGV